MNKKAFDTEIRHTTEAGSNIFLDLGLDPAEAKHCHEQLKQQITASRELKEQLMSEITRWIEENHLKQAQAAEILHVSRPRVSDIVNKKSSRFTLDTLVDMLSLTGKLVRITVG